MKITPLVASTFKSDGGATFGIVPRALWSRLATPDDRNRVDHHAHSLLLDLDDGRRALIETGCGPATRYPDAYRDHHGMPEGWPLLANLRRLGVAPEDVDLVILTHLHWDHAGGAADPDRPDQPAFPRARYVVHDLEWQDATSGDPVYYKSYLQEQIAPLTRWPADTWLRITGADTEVAPGVRMIRSGGHTRGHCCVRLESARVEWGGAPRPAPTAPWAMYASDLCPTTHHLRVAYQFAGDTHLLDVRRWKMHWLPEIARAGALLFLPHDAGCFGVTLRADPRREFVPDWTWPA